MWELEAGSCHSSRSRLEETFAQKPVYVNAFYPLQAGAKRVYAVEASSIAKYAAHLVAANKVNDVIKVLYYRLNENRHFF